MRNEVSFATTKEDAALVMKIVERAKKEGLCEGRTKPTHWYEPLTMTMDLQATNANGCPIDFKRLLEADAFTFTHDVAGIARHIDRNTGKLGDCFLPRTAMRQHA